MNRPPQRIALAAALAAAIGLTGCNADQEPAAGSEPSRSTAPTTPQDPAPSTTNDTRDPQIHAAETKVRKASGSRDVKVVRAGTVLQAAVYTDGEVLIFLSNHRGMLWPAAKVKAPKKSHDRIPVTIDGRQLTKGSFATFVINGPFSEGGGRNAFMVGPTKDGFGLVGQGLGNENLQTGDNVNSPFGAIRAYFDEKGMLVTETRWLRRTQVPDHIQQGTPLKRTWKMTDPTGSYRLVEQHNFTVEPYTDRTYDLTPTKQKFPARIVRVDGAKVTLQQVRCAGRDCSPEAVTPYGQRFTVEVEKNNPVSVLVGGEEVATSASMWTSLADEMLKGNPNDIKATDFGPGTPWTIVGATGDVRVPPVVLVNVDARMSLNYIDAIPPAN